MENNYPIIAEQFTEVLRQLWKCWSSLRSNLPTVQHEDIPGIQDGQMNTLFIEPLLFNSNTHKFNGRLSLRVKNCDAASLFQMHHMIYLSVPRDELFVYSRSSTFFVQCLKSNMWHEKMPSRGTYCVTLF